MKQTSRYPLKAVVNLSLSDSRVVITTLKMGTATLREITKSNENILNIPNQEFFPDVREFIEKEGKIESPVTSEMFKCLQAFDPLDPRPIFIFVRDPLKALASGVATVFSARMSDFKEPTRIYSDLYLELDKYSGSFGETMFADFGDDLFTRFLRFSIKYFPNTFFSDPHINNDYYSQVLELLLFLKEDHPDILKRVHILNLDDYSSDGATLKYLQVLKLITSVNGSTKVHSLSKYSHLVEKVIFNDIFYNNTAFLILLGNNQKNLSLIYKNFNDYFFKERAEKEVI